jgi:hypothetical protein
MSNNSVKRPHVVPASYLKFWDFEARYSEKGRRSQIYITDGEYMRLDVVENISIRKKYYSNENPEKAEEFFGSFESDHAELVENIVQTGIFPKTRLSVVIFATQMLYLLMRNPTFVHKYNENERINNVKIMAEYFWQEFFTPKLLDKKLSQIGRQKAILDRWGMVVLGSSVGHFITSDNPVAVVTLTDSDYDLFLLPISPNYTVCLYSRVKLPNGPDFHFVEASKIDTLSLNRLHVLNANREIYSNKSFTKEEIQEFKGLRENQTKIRNNFIGENGLIPISGWC